MQAAKIVKSRSGWIAIAAILMWAGIVPAIVCAAPPVVTQMYDNGHSGWNRAETVLTVANVKSSFKFLFKNATDGQTYAQPLFVPGLKIGPKKGVKKAHNVIFVATEHGLCIRRRHAGRSVVDAKSDAVGRDGAGPRRLSQHAGAANRDYRNAGD